MMRHRFGAIAIACAVVVPTVASGQAACGTARSGAGTRFYIEPVAVTPRDTTVAARLCLAAGPKGIGSYMATISYDSTRMRALRVDATGGMQVTNSRVAGTIRIAGASPSGFANGQLLLLTFRPMTPRQLAALTLVVTEASTPASTSVLGETSALGWPASASKAGKPIVDSISPRSGEVNAERVTDLVLYGRGFAPAGNAVRFGGAEVTGLLSEAGGTVIRFTAPTWIPARGGSGAHRVGPGRVQVHVRTAGGTSNPVTFLVRAGAR